MKRKGFAALLALALLLAGLSAAAEDNLQYYAGFFDYYYHACPNCALASTVAPVDKAEAEQQGKYPCPVCVDDGTAYGDVAATVRGGTLVIRVPDAWMKARPADQTGDNFSFRYEEYADSFFDEAGMQEMARQLHGADYRALMAAWDAYQAARLEGASAEAVLSLVPEACHAREPGIAPAGGSLLMHRRHIGAAWYLVYRPEEAARKRLEKEKKLDVDLYFTVNTLRAEGTVDADDPRQQGFALDVYPGGLWADNRFTLKPQKSKNVTDFAAIAEADGSALQLTVFRDMDTNICVVHQNPTANEMLAGAALMIDGVDSGINLIGYADDWEGIFCCVLTDAEANALKNGAPFALAARPDIASFF